MHEWFELWQWFSTGVAGYVFSAKLGETFARAFVSKFGGEIGKASFEAVKKLLSDKRTDVQKYFDRLVKDIGKQVAKEYNLRKNNFSQFLIYLFV